MSSNENKLPLKDALIRAADVIKLFAPFCDKIDIAGSIRRQVEFVGDIEIVCLPKKTQMKDLFGGVTGEVFDKDFISYTRKIGHLIKDGNKYKQIELTGGVKLDLFMPSEEDYYRILAIRTGSVSYVKYNISGAWKDKGWCGTDEGLRLQSECENVGMPDKPKWKCREVSPTLPPKWQSEEEFFIWLGTNYLPPEKRNI